MPTREFALEAGGPKRLVIRWQGNWNQVEIVVDQQVLGTFENQAALKRGADFSLPTGGTLHVQLLKSFAQAELQVLRDGNALPDSDSDPERQVSAASGMFYLVAGFNIVLGLVAELGGIEILLNTGLGYSAVGVGFVYALLGFLVKTYRSAVALGIGVALFAFDGLMSIVASIANGGSPPTGAIIFRVFLLITMFRGFRGIRALKAKAAQPSPT